MSSTYPTSFYPNNTPSQLVNVSMLVEKPCPVVPPVIIPYYIGSQTGWNAVLVGLLSSVLAILFLLTCLYYLACRRRYRQELSSSPTPVALVEKNGASSIPVTTSSQTATTTFINETGKETLGSTAAGNFVGMPMLGNGHTGTSITNGLLANGSADPSELRLLQHEHH